MTINKQSINYLMLKRQHLIKRAGEDEYEAMFKNMSPVHTLSWTMPGSPPVIVHRTHVDDYSLNNVLRSDRTIIKGRFQGGTIGYIYASELSLFMSAYKKEIKRFNINDDLIYNLIKQEGPMNVGLIKEITGLFVKNITPSLHKLQKAFLLYEDQISGEWDRSWYILEDEFYDTDLDEYDRVEAIGEIILRFAYMNVFIDERMVKSFTRLNNKDIRAALNLLLEDKRLLSIDVEGKSGYIRSEDVGGEINMRGIPPEDAFVFHTSDYAVKSHNIELKERFGQKPYTTISYIMLKGEFVGAVLGYFKQGPHVIEDIQLDMTKDDIKKYRDIIIDAIYLAFSPKDSPIKRFCGKGL